MAANLPGRRYRGDQGDRTAAPGYTASHRNRAGRCDGREHAGLVVGDDPPVVVLSCQGEPARSPAACRLVIDVLKKSRDVWSNVGEFATFMTT
jgi:hypothetical protein